MRLTGPAGSVGGAELGGPQPRLTLALLLVERRRCWSADALAGELWPGGPPARWRPAVRSLVSKTRHWLEQVGGAEVEVGLCSGGWRVRVPDITIDILRASAQVRAAVGDLEAGRYDVAVAAAGQARSVLAGPLLPGVAGPWADGLRRRAEEEHVEALLLLGAALRGGRRLVEGRQVTLEALRLAPYREDGWRLLMRIEGDCGNTAQALQVYEDCRRLLLDDLGTVPSVPTRTLHTSLLQDEPDRSPRRVRPARVTAAAG